MVSPEQKIRNGLGAIKNIVKTLRKNKEVNQEPLDEILAIVDGLNPATEEEREAINRLTRIIKIAEAQIRNIQQKNTQD